MNSTFNLQHSTLRVGFDAKRAFNNRTGLGNYSRFVIKGMLDHFPAHTYYLFTPKISEEFKNVFDGYSNVNIITPQSFGAKLFKSLWRSTSITGLCNELKLDVYHGLSNELPSNISKFKGKKIVTIHDLIFLRYPQYYKPVDRRIYERKFKQACINADVIVAASEQTANDITDFFGTDRSKISVVYQNCDEQFGKPLTDDHLVLAKQRYKLPDKFIVCVGTIEERKNQLTVLQSFHQSGIESSLVFVGRKTAYADQLDQYISKHKLNARVMFIEGASFSDFPAFYKLSQLAVYASEFEGFGIPVIEALRGGTKMLVAETSSLTEVGGDVVTYFDEKNPAQLALLFKQMITSPFQTDAVQKHLLQFDTGLLINKLHGVYEATYEK